MARTGLAAKPEDLLTVMASGPIEDLLEEVDAGIR
jgi:hypothetical protein